MQLQGSSGKPIKEQGLVYTPRWIVELILDEVGFDGASATIIDPACGSGAFLDVIVERVKAQGGELGRVVGVDSDARALEACRRKHPDIQLHNGDSLDLGFIKPWQEQFDFVVGNPPYIRIQNLAKEQRQYIQETWKLCASGSTDSYIAFFELGMSLLGEGGRLGYITPNTWLRTRTARALRTCLKDSLALKTLIDFGREQVFPEVTTYTMVSILEKGRAHDSVALKRGDSEGKISDEGVINLADLDEENWVLASRDKLTKLRRLRAKRVPLGNIAKIHVGLTTLADELFIVKSPKIVDGLATITHPITRSDVVIESALLRPIIKASILKSSEGHARGHERYIIFPYREKSDSATLIGEEELAEHYPMALEYFRSLRSRLERRDKGKPNRAGWYAFGRSQGLTSAFGKKILTSPINKVPNFIVWDRPEYAFYSGYCVKYDGKLESLAEQLNSEAMAFYINLVSREYQGGYKSYAKSFIENFPVALEALKA